MEISLVLTDDSGSYQAILGQFIETSAASTLVDRQLAQAAATAAAQSESNASGSASAAQASASAASDSAASAAADAVQTAADRIATGADVTAAAASASDASASADTATAQATAAAASASAAATSETNAAASASEAATTLANALVKTNNLSDVSNAATALSNIDGMAKSANLSDVAHAATARGNISAAQSGANSDITSLAGLTTALSIAQGGTGDTTAAGARAALGAAATATDLSQFASTSSAQLASVMSDETGTGKLVFGTSPTITTPNVVGITNGASSAAGSVGEYLENSALSVAVTSGLNAGVNSLNLQPGVWMVWGQLEFSFAGTPTYINSGFTAGSATLPSTPDRAILYPAATAGSAGTVAPPMLRVSLTAPTTIYLNARSQFTSTATASSKICALRIQ